MAAPAKQKLTSIVYGDTWNGISSINVQVNGEAPSSTLASARMQFRRTKQSNVIALGLSTSGGEIVIDDATNWDLSIAPIDLTLTPGVYLWDIEFTDSDDVVKTYVEGSLEILWDVSRNA